MKDQRLQPINDGRCFFCGEEATEEHDTHPERCVYRKHVEATVMRWLKVGDQVTTLYAKHCFDKVYTVAEVEYKQSQTGQMVRVNGRLPWLDAAWFNRVEGPRGF